MNTMRAPIFINKTNSCSRSTILNSQSSDSYKRVNYESTDQTPLSNYQEYSTFVTEISRYSSFEPSSYSTALNSFFTLSVNFSIDYLKADSGLLLNAAKKN